LIAPPITRIEFRDMQTLEVFLESLTDEGRSAHLLPPGCNVGGLQELCVVCMIFIVDFATALSAGKVGPNSSMHSGPGAASLRLADDPPSGDGERYAVSSR
jgi:hypothetical protein